MTGILIFILILILVLGLLGIGIWLMLRPGDRKILSSVYFSRSKPNRSAPKKKSLNWRLFLAIILVIMIGVILNSLRNGPSSESTNPPDASQPNSNPAVNFGNRTKTSGCIVNGKYPDKACTPGAILNVSKDQICTSGYSQSVRDVSESVKDQVYAEYGITSHSSGEYEIDHFIPLELGGSNDISNLFPEAANPTPGFHEKDKVENSLHDMVCNSTMSLQNAQGLIATDWVKVYNGDYSTSNFSIQNP